MINRNGSFIYGYMAGTNDRAACHPMNNESFENLAPEYREGYKAGYEGIGSVVIEMPDEIELCEGCGHELGPDRILLPEDNSIAMCPACAKKDDTESYTRLSVGDRVKLRSTINPGPYLELIGTIESLSTELGANYASVKWDGNVMNFNAQVLKECLIKVD